MKARLIKTYNKKQLLCADGTIANATEGILRIMFIGFAGAEKFHGKDGRWDEDCIKMEDYRGTTLAWVSDEGHLVIKDNPFVALVESVADEDYITIQEYAKLHDRYETRIKKLCQEGRIPGAVKKGNRWFVPKNAPYPQDARYTGVEK